jgi:hypothetical protein
MFSLSAIFICLGYASLTSELKVEGYIEAGPPEAVFIASVKVSGDPTNATAGEIKFGQQFGYTNLITNFTKTGYQNATIVYEIEVFNNTKYKYSYIGTAYETNSSQYTGNKYLGANRGINISVKDANNGTFDENDVLNPGESITFYATYKLGTSITRNKEFSTIVNYKFGIHVDSKYDYILDKVYSRFNTILNDFSTGGKYEFLSDVINDKYTGGGSGNQWRATYMGNVAGSTSADSNNVNTLFGEDLFLITTDGEESVTLLIKHEDVDGNENTGDSYEIGTGSDYISAKGCEYTLYMTLEDLNNKRNEQIVTVYAATFTCDVNEDGTIGNWYLLGDTYKGTAPVIGYEGGASNGSFHTDRWYTSNVTYVINDNYKYTIPSGQTIFQLSDVYDQNAITEMQRLLDRAYELIYEKEYSGAAMIKLKSIYSRSARIYTVNEDNTVTVKPNLNRSQIIPLMDELNVILKSFEGY